MPTTRSSGKRERSKGTGDAGDEVAFVYQQAIAGATKGTRNKLVARLSRCRHLQAI